MPTMFVALTALAAAGLTPQESGPPQNGDVIDFRVFPPAVRGWRYVGGQPCNSAASNSCWYGFVQRDNHLLVLVMDPLPVSRSGPPERARIRVSFPVERSADDAISSLCVIDDRSPALAVWDRATGRLRLIFFEGNRFVVEERKTDGHMPGCRFDEDEAIDGFG